MKEKIKSITEYKSKEEDKRKKDFTAKMAKVILLNEKSLKVN